MGEFNFVDTLKGGALEFLGTMGLGFAFVGQIWNSANSSDSAALFTTGMISTDGRIATLLLIGIAYWLTISLFGGKNGSGYFNPATALAHAFAGGLGWIEFGIFLLFQFLGFWMGFLIATWLYPGDVCVPKTFTAGGQSMTFPCAEKAIKHWNPFFALAPSRYRGTTYDNDTMGGAHEATDSVSGAKFVTSDEWGMGSALFFEFFFAFIVCFAFLKSKNNAVVVAGAYAFSSYLAMDVSGGSVNPAFALGSAFAGFMRGFTVNGAYVDQDVFTNGPGDFHTGLMADAAEFGPQAIFYDQFKALPSGAANIWINILAPFVGAIVAAVFNWGLADGDIFWAGKSEEPAV